MSTINAAIQDIKNAFDNNGKLTIRLKNEAQDVVKSLGWTDENGNIVEVIEANLTEGDAFRHAYAAAKSTYEYGALPTELAGYLNEKVESFAPPHKTDIKISSALMDIYNNNIGIEIGKKVSQLANKNNWDENRVRSEIGKRVLNQVVSGNVAILEKGGQSLLDEMSPKLVQAKIAREERINYLSEIGTSSILAGGASGYLVHSLIASRLVGFAATGLAASIFAGAMPLIAGAVISMSVSYLVGRYFDLSRPDITSVSIDPLVLDLNGDGVKLTAAEGGNAFFDIDADGIREQVGWVSAEDGLLVRDLNGNGKIDNINELIGDQTTDSYTILRDFDQNNDGKITSADNIWGSLKVWQDANSNTNDNFSYRFHHQAA